MSLDTLPVETTIEIACYLCDRDICSLRSACRATRDAVGYNSSPLWRELFTQQFDPLEENVANNIIRIHYQHRKAILNKPRFARFTDGRKGDQHDALLHLREIIVQALISPVAQGKRVKNLPVLDAFCKTSGLLKDVLNHRHKASSLLMAVQIMLSHARFDLTLRTQTLSFQDSQIKMYQPPWMTPIFLGRNHVRVNLNWVLHAVNFFKHYLTTKHAALESHYAALDRDEGIQPPTQKVRAGATPLGKSWKGVYAYLDPSEITALRSCHPPAHLEDRWTDSDDVFQSLEVQSAAPGTHMTWPACFERHLCSKSHPSVDYMRQQSSAPKRKVSDGTSPQRPKATRAQLRQNPRTVLADGPDTDDGPSCVAPASSASTDPSISPVLRQFHAYGDDEESFLTAGYTSALPPQQGIPGWQRFTMMKFFVPEEAEELGEEVSFGVAADMAIDLGLDGLWAYEGVVLPGGNIIAGRWWSPGSGNGLGLEKDEDEDEEGVYEGPFLLWCTD